MSTLEEYLEGVATLPSKVQANFFNIRELDDKCLRLVEEVQQTAQQLCELEAASRREAQHHQQHQYHLQHQHHHHQQAGGGGGGGIHQHQQHHQLQQAAGQQQHHHHQGGGGGGGGVGVKRSRRSAVTEATVDARLDPLIRLATHAAEDKVKIASLTYDMVDKHIQRLDMVLRKQEEDVRNRAEKEGVLPVTADSSLLEGSGYGGGRRKDAQQQKSQRLSASSAQQQHQAAARHPDLDLPIDPNEPTYCVCNRVSFGEMIACDHATCKIEWFHFECVGLNPETHNTKGKWYCPECASLRKKTK